MRHYTYGRFYDPRIKAGELTSLITSRGCPYSCRFCSRTSLSARRYRPHFIPSIIRRLHAIQTAGYRIVAIMDDCFPPPLPRAHALFDAILKENLDLKFIVTAARVDLADPVLYRKMKRAGVVSVQFGCESGCQEILDFYHKQTTVEQIEATIRLSHEMGFITIGSFIFGAPAETVGQMRETLRFAKKLPFDSVSFLPLRYMVGSELWDEARKEGKISEDKYIVIADSNRGLSLLTEKQLVQRCQAAQFAYYLRPQYGIRLLSSTLRRNDSSFLRAFLSSFR